MCFFTKHKYELSTFFSFLLLLAIHQAKVNAVADTIIDLLLALERSRREQDETKKKKKNFSCDIKYI